MAPVTGCSENPPSLEELGSRICIMGPSNSGKSTLAAAIGRKRDLSVTHLDQFSHYSDRDWTRRPTKDFVADHDAAIAQDAWVIEGNYSVCLPQRLKRATGFILLDVSTLHSLWRYALRELSDVPQIGRISSARRRISLSMIAHIAGPTRRNRLAYRQRYEALVLPKRLLASRRESAAFWATEQLER